MRFWRLLVGKDLGDRVAGYIGSGVRRRIPTFLSYIMIYRRE